MVNNSAEQIVIIRCFTRLLFYYYFSLQGLAGSQGDRGETGPRVSINYFQYQSNAKFLLINFR